MSMNVYEYYAYRAMLEQAGRQVRRRRVALHLPEWLTWQRAALAVALAGLTYAAAVLPEVPAEAALAGYALVALAWTAQRVARWAGSRARGWWRAWSGQPLGEEGIRALLG